MPVASKTNNKRASVRQSSDELKRTLIGGVGYRNLRDMSVGPFVIEELRKMSWPEAIELEDLSYGPIAVMQNLEERPPYDRLILIAGEQRNRRVGEIYRYPWRGELPSETEIQRRVNEAVTGVISLDNLLIITEYFKVLPPEVIVFEIEAGDVNSGPGFSQKVEAALDDLLKLVQAEAMGVGV